MAVIRGDKVEPEKPLEPQRPIKRTVQKRPPKLLGDRIQSALNTIGVTEDVVSRWLGKSCGGCEKRRQKLNSLDAWARRVLDGKLEKAREYLEELMCD